MKALLVTGRTVDWTARLGLPWPLLPFANRPLLEYWFELCLDLGIRDVTLVLGEGADRVEAFAGDGERWGIRIDYGFLRDDRPPASFVRRSPELWREGLLYVADALFPRRTGGTPPLMPSSGTFLLGPTDAPQALLTADPAALDALMQQGTPWPTARPFAELGIDPVPMASPQRFFDLNMALLDGENARYVTAGYHAADGSAIGYNVIVSPSARMNPPLAIGNDCRIGALATVGPGVVVGNRVVLDRQSELSRCIVLDGTYVGQGVDLKEKIVAGERLMDPEDGMVAAIPDPWLLARIGPGAALGDAARAAAGWLAALVLVAVQVVPFLLLAALVAAGGSMRLVRRRVYGPRGGTDSDWSFEPAPGAPASTLHRLFRALGLDLFPRLATVLAGRLRLCGHDRLRAPDDHEILGALRRYQPAVLHYGTAQAGPRDPLIRRMEALYYEHHRSIGEDLRILARAVAGRLFGAPELEAPNGPDPRH